MDRLQMITELEGKQICLRNRQWVTVKNGRYQTPYGEGNLIYAEAGEIEIYYQNAREVKQVQ